MRLDISPQGQVEPEGTATRSGCPATGERGQRARPRVPGAQGTVLTQSHPVARAAGPRGEGRRPRPAASRRRGAGPRGAAPHLQCGSYPTRAGGCSRCAAAPPPPRRCAAWLRAPRANLKDSFSAQVRASPARVPQAAAALGLLLAVARGPWAGTVRAGCAAALPRGTDTQETPPGRRIPPAPLERSPRCTPGAVGCPASPRIRGCLGRRCGADATAVC